MPYPSLNSFFAFQNNAAASGLASLFVSSLEIHDNTWAPHLGFDNARQDPGGRSPFGTAIPARTKVRGLLKSLSA